SIDDPFQTNLTNADGHVYYGSADGTHWVLFAYTGSSTGNWMWRTDSSSMITEGDSTPSIP
ncbi:MAG: hypothetical protein ACP5GW_04310, partial [Caldisericaceae bacterium]